jgi:hypothetical protein
MTNSSSKNQPGITTMRWIARIVSIPWAYCALGLAWFVAGYGLEEGKLSPMAVNIIVFIAFLVTLGAAILAGVWKMEAVGGWVLLADCVLIFICFVASSHSPWELFLFIILPPLLAGTLFLSCHYKLGMVGGETGAEHKNSKTERKQPGG